MHENEKNIVNNTPTPGFVAEKMCREIIIMKKQFIILTTTFFFYVFFSISASAEVHIDKIYYELNKENNEAELTEIDYNYFGKVVIPAFIIVDGIEYSVTKIGDGAFYSCKGVTSVSIPNSVTNIGSDVFSGCSSLSSITMPNSVTKIGTFAFAYCRSLTSITIPNSITTISMGAFLGCTSLSTVEISNSVIRIEPNAFAGCDCLKSVTIPSSVTCIGSSAFEGCRSLFLVDIPNSVTEIGNSAFKDCYNLTSINIPHSVTKIGSSIFEGCVNLANEIIVNDMFVFLPKGYNGHYSIPNKITKIINGAFSGCSRLTSVEIPNSVNIIENSAFSGCSGMTHVNIPETISTIGVETFEGCSSLKSIEIPNYVTIINQSAFLGCTSLISIIMGNSVKSIGKSAFENCTSLTSVSIPNSIYSIEDSSFKRCTNLKDVFCYAENISYCNTNIFEDSSIEYATLHIPESAIETYKTSTPWSKFGKFMILDGTETRKCSTPSISYIDGTIHFSCDTEGAEFYYTLNNNDTKIGNTLAGTKSITLEACYDITCYATASGYKKSDVATAKLYWLPTSGSFESDNLNNVSMRGISIQTSGGFINISGLNNNERIDFYGIDGKILGSATAINGTTSFATHTGSVVVAKFGKKSIKISVE